MCFVQEWGQKHLAGREAWKWETARFDLQKPISKKAFIGTYVNLQLQLGPKPRKHDTKAQLKRGHSRAGVIAPSGTGMVKTGSGSVEFSVYVRRALQRSMQTLQLVDERPELERALL